MLEQEMNSAPQSTAHRPPNDPADNISAGTQIVALVETYPKHAMHLLRLLITGAAALRTASVPVRVDSHRDRLLAVKRGEIPWPGVDTWRKQLHRDFEHTLAETKLPERPDYEAANRFLVAARREAADQR